MTGLERLQGSWRRQRNAASRRRALRTQNTLEKPRQRGGGFYGGGGDCGGGGCG